MGTAAQIRSRRIRAGKSQNEVAQHLGLETVYYEDLEHQDDELISTLTLFQAMELASILDVGVHDLLSDRTRPDRRIALADLPARINAYVAREGLSIEQLEDELSWELRDFLRSPLKEADRLPIMFFQAIAARIGIDWLSLIPAEHPV